MDKQHAHVGLVEGFYDPDAYNPAEGKFIMGLQFHPERMRQHDSVEFDYPGCPFAYKEFAKAVIAYQKKLNCATTITVPKSLKLDWRTEKKRKLILRSFSIGSSLYNAGHGMNVSEFEVGSDFLEV